MADAALREAIESVGGIGALGRALRTSRQAVAQWERAPSSRVLEIERVSGVPRFRLRPDLYRELDYWSELAARAAIAADAERAARDAALEAVHRAAERIAKQMAIAADAERAAYNYAYHPIAPDEGAAREAKRVAALAEAEVAADRTAFLAAHEAAERAAERAATAADAEHAAREAYERFVIADLEQEGALAPMRMLTWKDLQAPLEEARTEMGLDKRLDELFALVSDRLEQVHKGLREMQNLATGVGDLKRVLSKVQSRGGWGEMQLRMLLQDMLTQEQLATNVNVRPDLGETVDFAVRLPGRGEDGQVWLIEVKSHGDYDRLLTAQESGVQDDIDKAGAAVERAIRLQAKTICEKYIQPPHTTDFAILYLPTDRLFAEVIRRPGLVTDIQANYRIMVQGPTALAALLTSLQMGWAIEKRSSEVSVVLGAANAELEKYRQVWKKFGKQLDTARKQLDTVRKTVEDAFARMSSAAN